MNMTSFNIKGELAVKQTINTLFYIYNVIYYIMKYRYIDRGLYILHNVRKTVNNKRDQGVFNQL